MTSALRSTNNHVSPADQNTSANEQTDGCAKLKSRTITNLARARKQPGNKMRGVQLGVAVLIPSIALVVQAKPPLELRTAENKPLDNGIVFACDVHIYAEHFSAIPRT